MTKTITTYHCDVCGNETDNNLPPQAPLTNMAGETVGAVELGLVGQTNTRMHACGRCIVEAVAKAYNYELE